MLVQPSQTATVCEVDRARKRAASRKRAQTSDTGQPLETYHPETTHLTRASPCEDCSAFTRVAARTLAPSPIRDLLHRRLQPFRYLHDCSGCFRLERLPGGACTHWRAPPFHGAHVNRTLRIVTGDSQSALLNLAASSDPLVASPALYECAPAPASLPPSTISYSFRSGRFSNQHSRISRVPAA